MNLLKNILFSIALIFLIQNCGQDPVKPTTGSIEGVVYDFSTGALIGNANIVTTPPSSSVTSDTLTGAFTILHVDPGVYRVRAQKVGYDSTGVNIAVIADDKTIADIALKTDSTLVDTTQVP
jgi:Carboxypeptidase regulatory-like domain